MPDVSAQQTPSGSLRSWRAPIAKAGEGPASALIEELLRQMIGADLLAVVNNLSAQERSTLLSALGASAGGSAAHIDIVSSAGDFRTKRAEDPPATVLVAVAGFTSNSAGVREVDGGYVTTVRSGDIFIYDTTSPIWKRIYSATSTGTTPSGTGPDLPEDQEQVIFVPAERVSFPLQSIILEHPSIPTQHQTGRGFVLFVPAWTGSPRSGGVTLQLGASDGGKRILRTDLNETAPADMPEGFLLRVVYNGEDYVSNIRPPAGTSGQPGVSGSFERTLYRAADSQPPTPTTPHAVTAGTNPAVPTGWGLAPTHTNLDSPIWVTIQRVERGSTTVTYTEPTPWGSSAIDAITFVGPARVSVNGDVIRLNTVPSPTSYVIGQRWQFFVPAESPPNSRSGAPRLQLGSLPAKQILRTDLNAATASDIITGETVTVVYNGTSFLSDIEPPASGATGSPGVPGSFERSLFQRSVAQPPTPAVPGTVASGAAPGIPVGWSEQPPTGQSTQPTWVTIQRVPRGLTDVSYTQPVIAYQGVTSATANTDFKLGWSEDLTLTDAELSVSSSSGTADVPSGDGPSAYLVVWRADSDGGDPDHVYVNGVDWRDAYFGDAVDFTSGSVAGKAVFTNVRQTRLRLSGATVRVS